MATSFTTHSAGQVIASADINLIQTAVNTLENTPAVAANDLCENLGGTSFNTYNRKLSMSTSVLSTGTGLILVGVTAPITITAAKIKIMISVAGTAGPTLSQLGLFSIASNGDGTLIASTSTTSNFNATGYLSFNLTGPVAVTAGSRYAVGIIQSNLTGPTLVSATSSGTNQPSLAAQNPWVWATRAASTTSLPASFLFASLSSAAGSPNFYAEIST